MGHSDPNLPPIRAVAEDHHERRADGCSKEEPKGQEGQLGRGHAGSRSSTWGWCLGAILARSVAASQSSVNPGDGAGVAARGGTPTAAMERARRHAKRARGEFGCSVPRSGGRLTVPAAPSCRPPPLASASHPVASTQQRSSHALTLDVRQEFLVQPVDASWLQCNIECQEACPVGTNCRGYLNLAAEGRFEEGYILSREPNPVAAMCSYVCSAPCERACRRGDIDRPLAIRAMKRFLVEWHEASGIPDVMPHIEARGETVAVVGAGPAGIAVARELALKGYGVDVYDSLPFGGGTMLIGVPAFRLPREAIEMDIKLVERLGVTFHYNTNVGVDLAFDELQRTHDAVAITAGAMNAVALDVPGGDLEGVQYGVDFMKKANLGEPIDVGTDVVVIGGGYTAMDCSRTSLRHGAENVAIVYRRTRSELVVDEEELGETEREGVRMEFLASPIEVIGEDGHVTGVKFIRNKLGEPDASGRRSPVPIPGSEFVIKADTVIPAVSQAADLTFLPVESDFEVNRGRVKVDPATYATNVRGVFACGDFVTGPTTLIEAAGHGKKCAYAIDRYLAGRTDVTVAANVKMTSSWVFEMPEFYDVLPRQHIPMTALPDRMPSTDPDVNFTTQVERGYDATAAVAESTRCLMCNFNIWFDPFRCVLCGACADVCPEGVIHMVDINQLKSEGLLTELDEAYGWQDGAAMILDEERCIRCALCVKRCPFDAITMERFELQEISTDGRLYKESYRDAQLAGTAGVAGGMAR
jgi:formate dehydrogenase beta subunit